MNRYKASSIHFLGSAVVLFLVFALVRWIWYPERLFSAASGTDLLTILVPIDWIVGPLITLVIFNPQKKSLKFDMACVLICQIAFLLYGVWSIFSARPAYLAFVENRFQLVTANEINPDDQAKATNPAFRSLPLLGPMYVATKLPDDSKLREEILFAGMFGMGVQNLPQYFTLYSDAMPSVKAAGKAAKDLTGLKDDERQRLLAYELQQSSQGKGVRFVPLRTKRKLLYVAVDVSNGAVVEIL